MIWTVPAYHSRQILHGANVNTLSLSDYRLLKKKPKLNKPVSNVSAHGNPKLNIIGRVVVPVKKHEQKQIMLMVVCDEERQSIIGLGGIKTLNLV